MYEVACMVASKVAKVEISPQKAKWCLAILGADMEKSLVYKPNIKWKG
jgi:hypothetical protein